MQDSYEVFSSSDISVVFIRLLARTGLQSGEFAGNPNVITLIVRSLISAPGTVVGVRKGHPFLTASEVPSFSILTAFTFVPFRINTLKKSTYHSSCM